MTKTKFPIEIEITVKQDGETKQTKLKILGCFGAEDRLNELDNIPKMPYGNIDNWLASKMLCEKDGGRLPTNEELALIAGLQEAGVIKTDFIAFFWSASEVSAAYAQGRGLNTNRSNRYTYSRLNRNQALCVGD